MHFFSFNQFRYYQKKLNFIYSLLVFSNFLVILLIFIFLLRILYFQIYYAFHLEYFQSCKFRSHSSYPTPPYSTPFVFSFFPPPSLFLSPIPPPPSSSPLPQLPSPLPLPTPHSFHLKIVFLFLFV